MKQGLEHSNVCYELCEGRGAPLVGQQQQGSRALEPAYTLDDSFAKYMLH
jgi:hypothetical protein